MSTTPAPTGAPHVEVVPFDIVVDCTSTQSCSDLNWRPSGTDEFPFTCASSLVAVSSASDQMECATADVSIGTAADTCSSIGARLCSAAELEADVARGSGCQLDFSRVWTHTPCENGGYVVARGSTKATGLEPVCLQPNSGRANVRCCSSFREDPGGSMGCGFVHRTPVTAAPVTAPTARFEEGASNALVLTFAGNASTMDSTTEAEFQAQIQREIEARFGEMVVLRVDIPVKDPAVAVVIFERGSASPNALLLAQSSVQAQPIRIYMPALNEDMVTVGAYPSIFDQPEGHPAIVTANGPSQCHKNTFDLLNSDPPPSVVFSGSWQQSTSTSRIAHLGQDELTTATFYPRMAQMTTVDVYLRYEAADEFASRVDVLVHSMNGATQIHINQQLAADADDLTGHRLFLGQFEFGSLGSLDNDRVTINVSSSSGQGSWATIESVLFAEVAPCASATTVSDIENEDDDDVSSTYVSQSQDTAGGPTPTSVTVTIVLCATLVVLVVSAVVWRLNSGSKLRNNLSKSNWGHGLTRNDALGSGPLSPLQWDSSTEQLGTSAS